MHGHVDVIKMLFEAKANFNFRMGSAFDYAVVSNQPKSIKALLECEWVDFHAELLDGNPGIAPFAILQLLKKYIISYPWQDICPSIALKHLEIIDKLQYEDKCQSVLDTILSSHKYSISENMTETGHYLSLLSSKEYLVGQLQQLMRNHNVVLYKRRNQFLEWLNANSSTSLDDKLVLAASIKLQSKLNAAMEYANRTCLLGTNNRIGDIEHTNGWSYTQHFHYQKFGGYFKLLSKEDLIEKKAVMINSRFDSDERDFVCKIKIGKWFYRTYCKEFNGDLDAPLHRLTTKDPLNDSTFNLLYMHHVMLKDALRGIAGRYGNCGTRVALVSKYLWENPQQIKRIEGVSLETFDHEVVVVNRSPESRLSDPDTWGDAWIIDAWYKEGVIFHVKQFKDMMKQIKQHTMANMQSIKDININPHRDCDSKGDAISCSLDNEFEIDPAIHRYPSYSPFMRFENYYQSTYSYPVDFLKTIRKVKKEHRERFSKCLSDIENFHRLFTLKRIPVRNNQKAVNEQKEQRLTS